MCGMPLALAVKVEMAAPAIQLKLDHKLAPCVKPDVSPPACLS